VSSPGVPQKALFAGVFALWLLCFALQFQTVVRGQAFSSVNVAAPATPDDYPSVTGLVPYVGAEESGLLVGDRLLRVGEADLRGVSPLGVWLSAAEEGGTNTSVRVVFERGSERRTTDLPLGSAVLFWSFLPLSVVFVATASLLYLRSYQSESARAFAATFMCAGFLFSSQFFGSKLESYAGLAVFFVAFSLNQPLWIRALLLFPHDVRPTSKLARWGPWCLLIVAPLEMSRIFGAPLPTSIGYPASYTGLAIAFCTGFYVLRRAYGAADAIGRRKLRIVLFGGYCTAFPPIAALVVAALLPHLSWVTFAGYIAVAALPISLIIAITRYNLFDIDRLISATATYNAIAVVFIAAGLVIVPRTAQAASTLLGLEPSVGQAIVSLLLASLIVPASRMTRPWIESMFFVDRYAVDQGFQELLSELAEYTDPVLLTKRLGERIGELLRPDACIIYQEAKAEYSPSFVAGRTDPPTFEATSPLVASLRQSKRPLVIEAKGGRRDTPSISPFDRAALETLAAAVVVPVRHREDLLGFVCLGEKSSGDVYTSTDIALLSAVADKASLGLTEKTAQPSADETTKLAMRFGRYEVGEQVGSGGCAVVYRAQDPTIGRTVALKVIGADPVDEAASTEGEASEGERRFLREAAAAGSLQHPHIVTLYDAGCDSDCYYLAMEFVEGETFAQELQRRERVPVARAIEVGVSVAEALDYAHEHGVVHRDIKPGNLLVLPDGTVKVADFGIARLTTASTATVAGTFLGTPNYVSPEQLSQSEIDGRSDLFSLGIVLYEALTGEHPFRRASLAATINAIVTFDPKPPDEIIATVPAAASRAIMRALEKDPGNRFQHGRELAEALRARAEKAESSRSATTKRRLTTILSADAVGYSRLMGRDETGTLESLKTRRHLMDELFDTHDGRVFGTAGDSIVAEFASAVEAVRCAVEIQQAVARHNADLPEDHRMLFRIGINLGDVIVDGGNLFGDGVNISARLQALAAPGGICLSATTYEQVRRKLPLRFEDLGDQAVKNIAEPVRVYRVGDAVDETA